MTQPNDPLNITDSDALLELIAKNRQGQARMIDDRHMSDFLRGRVRGQDSILHGVSRLIRLQWGKLRRDRPIANLMFVGPPATGKTELAKTMAEYLFGDETNMVRFDCNELSSPEAKNQLLGVPAFYKNSEMGGALTTRMAANPRQLVLFDEIEKAHPIVFDLFLSMMGEGRVTQPSNNTTIDFTQAIIVLTSNKAHKALLALSQQIKDPLDLSKAARATWYESSTSSWAKVFCWRSHAACAVFASTRRWMVCLKLPLMRETCDCRAAVHSLGVTRSRTSCRAKPEDNAAVAEVRHRRNHRDRVPRPARGPA